MFRLFLFVAGICVLPSMLKARHIIGSDFWYECQGPARNGGSHKYKLHLDVYRDCSTNIFFNQNAAFAVYSYSPQRGYRFVDQFTLNYGTISRLKSEQNPCIIVPPNVCVETTYYDFLVELPDIDETYVIFYIQCCRNRTILNIPDPGSTGSTFFIEISPTAQKSCNNSPKFKSFPPIVICAEFPFSYDHSATDAEGDSLVYNFCQLLAGGASGNQGGGGFGGGGGQLGGCNTPTPDPRLCPPPFKFLGSVPGFSYLEPLGKGILSLDPLSGLLTGMPVDLGQYVVGVCVDEYRNGVLIGSLHRDFQFNVAICEEAVYAKIKADSISGKNFTVNYCGDNLVSLQNESTDPRYITDYFWEFKPKSGNTNAVLTSTDRNAKILFANPGQYKGMMIVNRNALICNDTAFVDLNIIPSDIKADFDFKFDQCNAAPIKFNNRSSGNITPVKTITWQFGDSKTSSLRDPVHLFDKPGAYDIKLIVTDGKICKSEKTLPLNYFPSPALLDILPDRFRACVPASIFFNNLSIPVDSTYDIEWDFGDGSKAKTIDALHQYKKPGVYTIKLTLKAPSGCITSEIFPNFVSIQEGPEAEFSYNPKNPDTKDPNVQFNNKSKGGVTYLWDFGDESGSVDFNPNHKYQDTGTYDVILTTRHQNGCTDTAHQSIRVGLNISYFLPNAFTPNNDGKNDLYLGIGSLMGMQNFELKIFNRWGELIYNTNDPTAGWNGRKQNIGPIEPNGVYVCTVKYQDDHGTLREIKGLATLVR